jgi:MFS family permease
MRFAAVIGALVGFLLGFLFNEYLSKTRTHQDSWRPEYRLFGVFIPAIFECAGLLLFGFSNQFKPSWVALVFGWCMVNVGLVGTVVAITAFVLEKYPAHATTVSATMNMWRSCGKSSRFNQFLLLLSLNANKFSGGFSMSYYQAVWVAASGVGVVFGIQAAIIAFFICITIVPVIIWGKKVPGSVVDGIKMDRGNGVRDEKMETSD